METIAWKHNTMLQNKYTTSLSQYFDWVIMSLLLMCSFEY